MTAPVPPAAGTADSKLIRIAIWTAIGALIAAALVCFVWVLVGSENDLIGRAFLTILLLAAFAGVALLDVHLAPRRPAWFALTSMIVWVVILLLGAFLIWAPVYYYGWEYGYGFGAGRLMAFFMIVLILQLALLHLRLYMKAHLRHVTVFTRTIAVVTIALVAVIAILLVLPLAFGDYIDFREPYGRWIVALAILAAVGTALIPLMNALFAPKKPQAQAPVQTAPPVAWPTYADGVTPLPVMFDGSPDWNAYYTGYPTTVSQAIAPVAVMPVPPAPGQHDGWQQGAWQQDAAAAPPAQSPEASQPPTPSGYEGYPPRPPLPPR